MHAVVGVAIFAFVCLYLMLPMELGVWWYVFPREITAAAPTDFAEATASRAEEGAGPRPAGGASRGRS